MGGGMHSEALHSGNVTRENTRGRPVGNVTKVKGVQSFGREPYPQRKSRKEQVIGAMCPETD